MSAHGIHSYGKGAIAWMTSNSVASNLLMLVLVIGGIIVAGNIKQEVFPEFDLDTVTVSVPYPGASPDEVEKGVVLAIEQAIQGVDGVDEVRSTASEGMGRVTVEALEGADVDRLWQDIKSEVDRINTFPDESEDPRVVIDTRRRDVMTFAIHGDVSEHTLRLVADDFRDALLLDPGITLAELEGARDLEIHVEISQGELRRYGLTLDDVAQKIAQASVEVGGGSMRTSQGEILVRVTDRRDFASEFSRIPVKVGEGGDKVLLEDVATISEGFEDTNKWASFDGNKAAMVEVYRVGSQTPIAVADAAKGVAEEFEERLPSTVQIDVLKDRSHIFKLRADLLLRNAWMGLSLVFISLALFLEIRLAFWVSLGIPISFLGSFLFLSGTDFSINMITMFAFIITLGIVVDDAIVVGENVYHHRRRGQPFLKAAVDGAKEVAGPVTFSVITNIVAFMPMYFVPGRMGKVFMFIPVVVGAVFAVSLIESLFVLPAHLSHGRNRTRFYTLNWVIGLQERFSTWFEGRIFRNYGRLLDISLKNRYLVLAMGLALLLATVGYVRSGRMGMELFPRIESDYAYVEAVLPYGASEDSVRRVEDTLVKSAKEIVAEKGGDTLSKGIFSEVEENRVEARVYLTDPDVRPLSTTEITGLWRERVGVLPGLETITFESDRGGPGSGKGLSVRLSHRDTHVLDLAGQALGQALADFEGVSDIDDGAAKGKRQFDITLLPTGEAAGISSIEVARQVRHAFLGAEALKQQRGRDEITVRVRLPEEERATLQTLEDMVILLPGGQTMLLRELAEVTPNRAYTSIERTDGRRVSMVTANVNPRSLGETIVAELKEDVMPQLGSRFPGLTWSFEGRQADLKESMVSLYQGLLMALLCIFGLLAIPFRSYLQPLIIMFCIPFGIIGAVFGHLIMGYSLSLMSMFGVVALSGVVVNDSLVLIDFANRRVRKGEKLLPAVKAAGIQRFRPIMLTTLTTCGGLAPMILETSRQARFLIPMAISLGFGILFATFITLLMVPALYLVLEDVKDLVMGWFRPAEEEGHESGE